MSHGPCLWSVGVSDRRWTLYRSESPDQWGRSRRQRTMDNAWYRPIGELRSTIAAAHTQPVFYNKIRSKVDWRGKQFRIVGKLWLTMTIVRSRSESNSRSDVTIISVWVTAATLWVIKRYNEGSLSGVSCHLVIRDKNRNLLTPHILIDHISHKSELWVTEITCNRVTGTAR